MTMATLVFAAALAAPRPPTVAVSYFDNNTGQAEMAPLAKGLADMLITDLAAVPGIQIVEREKLNQALAELQLSRSRFIDPATAQKLGRGLAARYLLTGGYTMAGTAFRIDARVFNVETGAVVASRRVEGTREEFFDLEARLVAFLAGALQVKVAGVAPPSKASGTRSFDALTQYSAGLDAQDQGDEARAKEMFEKALRTDPGYQASRTASERLAAIFARRARERTAAADRTFEGLDPQAPDFAAKVDTLLTGLRGSGQDQLGRKIAVLTWLGERGLLACTKREAEGGGLAMLIDGVPAGGGTVSACRQASEVLMWAYRQAEDPSQWDVVTRVCEYFIHQLPRDLAAQEYCESEVLERIGRLRSWGLKSARGYWANTRKEAAKLPRSDWRRVRMDNDPAIKAMLALYARAADGAAATTPPAEAAKTPR